MDEDAVGEEADRDGGDGASSGDWGVEGDVIDGDDAGSEVEGDRLLGELPKINEWRYIDVASSRRDEEKFDRRE